MVLKLNITKDKQLTKAGYTNKALNYEANCHKRISTNNKSIEYFKITINYNPNIKK